MRVEIWTDIACPWCYSGRAAFAKGLAAFEHRDEVEVVQRSYELNPDAKNGNSSYVDVVAKQYGRTNAQQVSREEQAAELARGLGLDFIVGGRRFGNTFDLHRLIHFAKTRGLQDELADLVFRANFGEERSVYDRQTQIDVAVASGLDEAEVVAVLDDPTAFADEVRSDEREAVEVGAQGVPFVVLDRRYSVGGVQSAGAYTKALEQAWANRSAA
ncbi:DsbA family oxidoreductase [Streptomyces sp. NBC_01341]|uniref:DsbA family oxidoreductase n=1 Tax=Streptomyces sp. NBC_01341 TaxID=2903831 RepID=UPI002E0ECB1A|nr:DsbA family oxidoreductase [Streptomyces sp. NBC_01341]